METTMVIKVDLQCCRCYKKIKKILCNFPQIRDQKYDEKNNTVTIIVVCCNPEKIKQKICCKGGESIQCIKIITLPPPVKPPQEKPPQEKPPPEKPPQEKPPPENQPPEKPPPEKPTVVIVCPPAPKPFVPVLIPIGCPPANRIGVCCEECYEGRPGGPCLRGHGRPVSPPASPIGVCCEECSEGRPGGPCFRGLGRPPPPCYEGYGRPVYDSWGGGSRVGYHPSRCDYFCEENPSSCTIM